MLGQTVSPQVPVMSWKHFLMSFSLACSWRNLEHILGAAPPWRTSLLKGCQEAPLTHSVTLVSPNICCLCQLCVFWSERSPAPYHSFSYVLWHVNSSCSRSHRDSAIITSPQMESATADNDKISWRALESCWDSSLQLLLAGLHWYLCQRKPTHYFQILWNETSIWNFQL